MIPYTSCMCFGAERGPVRRRAWRLVSAQEGASLTIGKDETYCLPETEVEANLRTALSSSEACMLEALKDEKRLPMACGEQEVRVRKSRQPVITRVVDLNLLDDTYNGVTKMLLSKCSSWSFNTFNLDVATGGRSLSYLLVHLFQEYGFVNHFRLDIVKVWHCFNLMEAAYHRHNPYHNSVHAADVTQAMHCFLQENKFAAHLTPLETMSSVIAAVAHDLDHPGVTQAFLVATSNHLVNLYHNSSVLENHHWRTAISCLSESGIFSHLDKSVWQDIQKQIRSLILATDITRQKEFLARFKSYLSSQCLDMENAQYRHFALQIALKCADLCNPCRPWAISQRWSYQVCQEFYRQGAYERQLKLPLTPTFDCSKTKVAKIQADFFQFVVSPLFETWDHFLKTPLSSKLLKNLRHNYSQWQHRIEATQSSVDVELPLEPPLQPPLEHEDVPNIKVESCSASAETLASEKLKENLLSVDSDVVLKQHRSKSDSGLTPRLLLPKVHMETYSTEELHPSTTLLSLSSITNTVQLRKVYATTKVESHLVCPTVFQPIVVSKVSTKPEESEPKETTDPEEEDCENQEEVQTSDVEDEGDNVERTAKSRCSNGCCTPSPTNPVVMQVGNTKKRSQSLVTNSEASEQCSSFLLNRRASDISSHLYIKSPLSKYQPQAFISNQPSSSLGDKDKKSYIYQSENNTAIQISSNTFGKGSLGHTASTNMCLNKQCLASKCTCDTDTCKSTPSWCWHISRSLSAERPQRPTHEFDSPLLSWQGSASSLTGSAYSGRRGSAPVTMSYTGESCASQLSNVGDIDSRGGLRGGSGSNGPSGRRWSIPVETVSGFQVISTPKKSAENRYVTAQGARRHSFGLLEPLLALSALDPENVLRQNRCTSLKPSNFLSHNVKDELNEHACHSNSIQKSLSSNHQASSHRRGSLPAEVPIALMRRAANPSHQLRSKISDGKFSSDKEPTATTDTRSSVLWKQAHRCGSPSDLLSVLIGPPGMFNTMHGIISGQTICKLPHAQEISRRRSGGIEMLSGLWRSRTSEVSTGIGMASKLKVHRQLLDDWSPCRKEDEQIRQQSSSISTIGQHIIYQPRRGSVPLNVSFVSLNSCE